MGKDFFFFFFLEICFFYFKCGGDKKPKMMGLVM